MSLPQCSVQLDASSADFIDVSWTIRDPAFDALTCTFQVLRGESAAGPFDPVTEPLIDIYHVRDYIAPRRMHWRDLHYIVRVQRGEESIDSEPQTLRARPPLDALEMIRLNSLLFKEFVGRPCLVYPVRTFGQRCGACYDQVTGRKLVGNCRSCYGTGFMRGYHYPQYAYVQIEPEQRGTQSTDVLKQQVGNARARMSIYPLIKPGDIIVEREGTRHRVQDVATTERLRAPVQQMLGLFRINPMDIEYQIPVNWDSTVATSPRSFSTESDI
jgi:hypothetical protein